MRYKGDAAGRGTAGERMSLGYFRAFTRFIAAQRAKRREKTRD